MSSLTLNEKGAISFQSTFSPMVDLFGMGLPDFSDMSFEEFHKILEMCHKACRANPNDYVKMIKYRRSIKHVGQKMMYYVMMSVIRQYYPNEYVDILMWSQSCMKDLLRMARIFRRFNPAPEIRAYSDKILKCIKNNVESDMCFKYIGTHHFEKENQMIRDELNKKLEAEDLPIYTNSTLRKLYSSYKSKLHLADGLLQGVKEDGEIIVAGHEDQIVNELKKMSSKAFDQMVKTISAFSSEQGYKKVLYQACCILKEQVNNKTFSVKATGMNPIKDCYYYFKSDAYNPVLESMLTTKFNELRTRLGGYLSSIDLVIDNSGSMDGEPTQTAFYIGLMLHRLYHLESAVIFNSTAKRRYISGMTWYDTIKSLYQGVQGSTHLESVFSHLENNSNTTIIITDGDCDPLTGGLSPFQVGLERFPCRKFIVWNVKQKKLHFPYCVADQRVAYLSGNEPGLIEAVCKTLQKGTLSPETVLSTCLEEFQSPVNLSPANCECRTEHAQTLYDAIQKNIPNSI